MAARSPAKKAGKAAAAPAKKATKAAAPAKSKPVAPPKRATGRPFDGELLPAVHEGTEQVARQGPSEGSEEHPHEDIPQEGEQAGRRRARRSSIRRRPRQATGQATRQASREERARRSIRRRRPPSNRIKSPAAKPSRRRRRRSSPRRRCLRQRSSSPVDGIPKPKFNKEGLGYTKDFDLAFVKAQFELLQRERLHLTGQAHRLEAEAHQLVEEAEMGDVQFDDEGGEGDTMVVERERDLALSAQARETRCRDRRCVVAHHRRHLRLLGHVRPSDPEGAARGDPVVVGARRGEGRRHRSPLT